MELSWVALDPHRKRRLELVEAYTGSEWGNQPEKFEGRSERPKTLVNLMAMTVLAYQVSLVAARPRVRVSTWESELKPFSSAYQVALNRLIQKIHLEETLRQIVLDGFFGPGIAKIYWASGSSIEIPNPDMPVEPGMFSSPQEWASYRSLQEQLDQNIWVDPGQPMVMRVSFDDFGIDHKAGSFEKARYMWHEYMVPLSALQDDERVDQEVLTEVGTGNRWQESIFTPSAAKTAHLMSQADTPGDDVEPMIRVADVYLPFERQWAMMAVGGKVLYSDEWTGPETGPFRMLSFDDIPDNIISKAPGQDLKNLHDLHNSLLRKVANQARRQREIFVYQNEAEAKKVLSARDGQPVQSSNPDGVRSVKLGGADQAVVAFTTMLDGIYSRSAGNLDAALGLGPQSKTATQDELIHGALSRREEKMRQRLIGFTQDIVQDLGLMLWIDEAQEFHDEMRVEGLDEPFPVHWTPDEREGDFFAYNFRVEPYSMQYQSPQSRAQAIGMLMQQIYIPLMPMLQAAGGTIDLERLTTLFAELHDQPELLELIRFAAPAAPMQGQPGQDMPSSPGGPREVIRRNVSTQGSPAAQRMVTIQHLLNGADGGGQSQDV